MELPDLSLTGAPVEESHPVPGGSPFPPIADCAFLAEPLFSLLLGEKHRRRLLGIDPAPSLAQAAAHAAAALTLLGL